MLVSMSNNNKTDKKLVDQSRYRKLVRVHKQRVFLTTCLILLFVAGIIMVCYISYVNQSYTGYEVISTVEQKHTDNSNILNYGTCFLSYSADGIRCTDERGNDVWSCPYEMQNPMVRVHGDYVAVADYVGRTIYVFNKSGELGSIQTNLPIQNIEISGNGVVAVVLDDGDVTPIRLYYYDGREVATFRTTMSKSGYPLDVGLSSDGKLVAVSYLYLDNGVLTSRVAFYNFGEVGQNKTDNLVGGYDYQNEAVPLVGFMNNATAFAVANDRLMFYKGAERPTNAGDIFLKEEIRSVYYGDEYIGLTYLNQTGESKYLMDIYSSSGDLKSSVPIDMEYKDIFFSGDYVIIYNASSCMIYHVNGNIKYQGDFEESVLLMIPTRSTIRYVLVMHDKIQTIVLR